MVLSGAYISVCIGSGFATGQELLQFFSSQGLISLVAGFICMMIMCYCGYKLLYIGKTNTLRSSNDIFTYLFGTNIGNIFKIIIPVFSLCSFIVMVSGAGSAMNQYYGINKTLGGTMLALVSLFSVMLGMNKVLDILGNIALTIRKHLL